MKRKLCIYLLIANMTLTNLAGCGSNNELDIPPSTEETSHIQIDNSENESSEKPTINSEPTTKYEDIEANTLLKEQRNSFSMMYYLAITAEEIRTSKDNRLVLENIYTSLLNDINPGSVDEITQAHLQNLRDIIKSYLNISVKRERLQFIYNQEKASAIRNAVPNPLAVLSATNALDWKKFALTVVYTAVDSYNNYKKANEGADMAFIMSGWELDDEEKETVMKNRDRAFDYMVDMVQNYNLDGMKTLNEKAVEKFTEICSIENASERIKLLQAEESTYNLLGNYWLELADAYFEISEYEKCLACVDQYNNLATGIYRQDYNYLQILPKAIVATREVYSGPEYYEKTETFVNAIIANTSTDDWSIRYFAAQVYMDLYAKTNRQLYLNNAYKIASENVTVLLKEQRSLNDTYLNDVVEQTAIEPDYRYMTDAEKKKAEKEFKNEQKRVKDYNAALKEKRKTELPSLYEPLVLNCELLFSLADILELTEAEKKEIDSILQSESNGIFMVKPINSMYSFSNPEVKNTIQMTKDAIKIPAYLLTSNSKIIVTVTDGKKTTTIKDCVITKIEREGKNINKYLVHLSSKQMQKYKWTKNSKITISITYADAFDKKSEFKLYVSKFEKHWYGDKVRFKAE